MNIKSSFLAFSRSLLIIGTLFLTLLLNAAAAQAQQVVTSFTLVNADTDQDIGTLSNGATINLAALPTQNLNVRANTTPATVGSVRFNVDGQNVRTESGAPYTLFGDSAGDYFDGGFTLGEHTLRATPYSGSGASGTQGTPLTVTFTVVEDERTLNVTPTSHNFGNVTIGQTSSPVQITLSVPASSTGPVVISSISLGGAQAADFTYTGPSSTSLNPGQQINVSVTFSPSAAGTRNAVLQIVSDAPSSPNTVMLTGSGQTAGGQSVTSFTLINADTDQDITTLTNGAQINLAALPTTNLNVRANTNPATVGSVRFNLDGQNVRTESGAPYALFGDISGNYTAGNFSLGAHTLLATPFSGSSASGTAGTPLSVSFTVVNEQGGLVLQVSPTSHSFGTVTVGSTSVNQQFTLSVPAASSGPVTITSISLGGSHPGDFNYTGPTNTTLNPGQQLNVSVNFEPTTAGGRSANLQITSNAPSSPDSIALSGTGQQPAGTSVTALILVNADTDQDIGPLMNGDEINLAELGTMNLNIRAETNPATVGSVRFAFDGNNNFRTENSAPYAFAGDIAGDYDPFNFSLGAHSVTATPFSGSGAGGTAGTPLTVNFTVVEESALETIKRVNAGGPEYLDTEGNTWEADNSFLNGASVTHGNAIAGTEDDTLYQSYRRANSQGQLFFFFDVPNGDYRVTLLFAEPNGSAAVGTRVFNLVSEGQPVLTNYDIFAKAGALTATQETYDITVEDGVISLDFLTALTPAENADANRRPIVNAIQVDRIGGGGPPTVQFNKEVIASNTTPGAGAFQNPTSLMLGPDGRLYVGQQNGLIHIFTLSADHSSVTAVQVVQTIFNTPTANEPGSSNCPPAVGRQVTGIYVDPASSPSAPHLYVVHSDPRIGTNNSNTALCVDTDSGVLTRLTGPNFNTPLNIVTGLPRSRENHSPNGMAKGPDGWLYISNGGNTNFGAPSQYFSNLPEVPLSAGVVRVNINPEVIAEGGLPFNVAAGSQVGSGPGAGQIPGKFELFATGYRNGYDIVWHSNGTLYLNGNEGNPGLGSTPSAAHGCPSTPSINPATIDTQNHESPLDYEFYVDKLYKVTPGAYGGHPVPALGFCVYGNGSAYTPALTPHAAYTPPIHEYRTASNSPSTNGLAEYTSLAFEGVMLGDLLAVTTFGDSVDRVLRRVQLDPSGNVIEETTLANGFGGPLDLFVDSAKGTVFIAEFLTSSIAALTPTNPPTGGNPNDSDGDCYSNADETANNTNPFNPADTPSDFDGDCSSDLQDNDDDNDGTNDTVDPFQLDAANGADTIPPLAFEWNPGDAGLPGFRGSGFLGVQLTSNGTGFIPGRISVGAAGGFTSIIPTAGDMLGAANNQDNALQLGIDATPVAGVGAFTVTTRLTSPTPSGSESAGIFIGAPDDSEDNFIRVAVTGGGIRITAEINGTTELNLVPFVPLAFGEGDNIDLYLSVDPELGSFTPAYRVNSDDPEDVVLLSTVTLTTRPTFSRFLDEGLGVGIYSTRAGNASSSFIAVYDYFRLLAGGLDGAPAGAAAQLVVNPGGNVNTSSTFTNGSFQITNTAVSGPEIARVRIDLRTSPFSTMVFDPDGAAGDLVAKPFTPNSGGATTGLVTHQLRSEVVPGGYQVLDIVFDDFGPGELFTFSIDADPWSIRGVTAPGPADSGSVSGLELAGATVTIFLNDGTELRNTLFQVTGSLIASEARFGAAVPAAAPTLQVLGLPGTPAATGTASQVARIFGPPGATVALLRLEGGLYLTGVPGGGFMVRPFDANKLIAASQLSATIAGNGMVDIPFTLTSSDGNNAGINHLFAVIKSGANAGPASNVRVIELN